MCRVNAKQTTGGQSSSISSKVDLYSNLPMAAGLIYVICQYKLLLAFVRWQVLTLELSNIV